MKDKIKFLKENYMMYNRDQLVKKYNKHFGTKVATETVNRLLRKHIFEDGVDMSKLTYIRKSDLENYNLCEGEIYLLDKELAYWLKGEERKQFKAKCVKNYKDRIDFKYKGFMTSVSKFDLYTREYEVKKA